MAEAISIPLSDSEIAYLKKHSIHELFQDLLTMMMIQKPKDPLKFVARTMKEFIASRDGSGETPVIFTDKNLTGMFRVLDPAVSGNINSFKYEHAMRVLGARTYEEHPDGYAENKITLETFLKETKKAIASRISTYRDAALQKEEMRPALVDSLKECQHPIVWVLGGPGSGKGTQCDKIVQKYGFTHLSTGDILRDAVKSGNEKGQMLQAIMERGDLVPMETVLDLLKDAMISRLSDSRGYLIDGFPREIVQAEQFEAEIKMCDLILYFDVNDDTMVGRLLKRAETSGRSDDNETTIMKRICTFHSHSKPVVHKYLDKVKTINAERDPDAIFEDVCQLLDTLQ